MDLEQAVELCCPCCGEVFTTFIDTSQASFSTIEDCQVCCRPMQVDVECDAGEIVFIDVQRA